MKIIYYIHSLVIGGAETIVTDYLLELKKQGYQVALVVNYRVETFLQDRIDESGIPTYVLLQERNGTFFGKVARSIEIRIRNFRHEWDRIIEMEEPDIIHVHTSPKLVRDINFPISRIVYTFHSDVSRAFSMYKKRQIRVLYQWAESGANFFGLNNKACEDIKTLLFARNVVRIPNGVDLELVRAKCYDRTRFLSSIGVPTGALVIGHVGRFHPVKNHQKVLSVFKRIVDKGIDAYLLLVGTGTVEEINKIHEFAKTYAVYDRTVFLGLRDDAAAIMSVMDVLLLPSLSESFPLVLLEAQAHDVRCIVSSAVPSEVICNPNCVQLSIDESDEIWAEKALSEYQYQSTNNLNDFDIHAIVKRMCSEYKRIIEESGGGC